MSLPWGNEHACSRNWFFFIGSECIFVERPCRRAEKWSLYFLQGDMVALDHCMVHHITEERTLKTCGYQIKRITLPKSNTSHCDWKFVYNQTWLVHLSTNLMRLCSVTEFQNFSNTHRSTHTSTTVKARSFELRGGHKIVRIRGVRISGWALAWMDIAPHCAGIAKRSHLWTRHRKLGAPTR